MTCPRSTLARTRFKFRWSSRIEIVIFRMAKSLYPTLLPVGHLQSPGRHVVLHDHVLVFPCGQRRWVLHVFQELVGYKREVGFVRRPVLVGDGNPDAVVLLLDADGGILRLQRVNSFADGSEDSSTIGGGVWDHVELRTVFLRLLLPHLDVRFAAAINGQVSI